MNKFTSIEHVIRGIMSEAEAEGTTKRRMIKNVGRPDDGAPMSEKSKLAKQGEIKTKIIDENETVVKEAALPMDDVQPNGKDNSEVGGVKNIKNKKNAESDMDNPRKIKGGKTEVILDPKTDDKVNNETGEDNVSKKARAKANKEIGAKGMKEETISEKYGKGYVSAASKIEKALKAKNIQPNSSDKHREEMGRINKQYEKLKQNEEALDEISPELTGKVMKARFIGSPAKGISPKPNKTDASYETLMKAHDKASGVKREKEYKLPNVDLGESYEDAAGHMKKAMKCYETGDMMGHHLHMHNYHHTMSRHHAKHNRPHVADMHVKRAMRHFEEAAKFGPLETPGPDGKTGRHAEMANDVIKASAHSSHADAPFEPDDANTTINAKTKNVAKNLARKSMKAMIKKTIKETMYGGMNDSNATERVPTSMNDEEKTNKKLTVKKTKEA
jgi:hypothetical protein